jgi:SAM-dependent methyltransferase
MKFPLNLDETFGSIDIYLFDQFLKGRFNPPMEVLDAGCGSGRNLVYFLRSGFNVYGIDQSTDAIRQTRLLASALAPRLPPDNFRVEDLARMSFESESFDVVLSSAVLHFASSVEQWNAMVNEMWRVLKPGGIFFARLASSIGMEDQIKLIVGRRYRLPDGSDRFLVDEQMLMEVTASLDGEFIEPIKSVVVQNMRSMTTWCVRKAGGR